MDITGTTTTLKPMPTRRAAFNSTRRTYLDTYAKSRSQLNRVTKPMVLAVPVQTVSEKLLQTNGFHYQPGSNVDKKYLDILIDRHEHAVSNTPSALNEVIQPTLSAQTSAPLSENTEPTLASITANLSVFEKPLVDTVIADKKVPQWLMCA